MIDELLKRTTPEIKPTIKNIDNNVENQADH